ncbi:L2 minor capsid protein [Bos taurus papillomavirus 27]|nr:L2 minor capsid protein [Bos taurus papillomavirus 27]QYI89675.1 L2 minor capsid protein [Bos taurus papillomavirus 27]
MALRRPKRDSAENIYRTCKISGNCPEDVLNKVENNTIADRILKWLSGFLFFGNLGIGTGKGTGGTYGYVPIGGQGRGVSTGAGGSRVVRPGVAVDPIGPTDSVVIGEINPLPPDSTITNVTPTDPSVIEPGGGTAAEEIELEVFRPTDPEQVDNTVSIQNPAEDLPPSVYPTIDVTEHTVTEIRPTARGPSVIVSTTTFDNAIYNAVLRQTPGESIDIPIVLNDSIGATLIGEAPEEIELSTFDTVPLDEREYATSTPIERRPSRRNWRTDLYHRFYRQFDTGSTSFLRPKSGANFQFENPAFNYETGDLEVPTEQVEARSLGDIQLNKGPTGKVRASRLARLSGIVTRSGKQLGQFIHLFSDFSTIEALNNTESIELSEIVISDNNTPANTLNLGSNTLSSTETPEGPVQGIEEIELVDYDISDFENSRLRLLDYDVEEPSEYGTLESPRKAIAVADEKDTEEESIIDEVPVRHNLTPIGPGTVIIVTYDYLSYDDWEPSLRKRKRKRAFLF